MNVNEIPVVMSCHKELMCGILHQPDSDSEYGVLIIVGGPQYRVGSHRQFVLLARYLAENNVNVFRFDYRGMGDSSGRLHTFEDVNDDIRVAIDTFFEKTPNLKKLVIWGLCDAAAAGLMYAFRDERVAGLILLNPWVRTEAGEAKAILKHYYYKRILDKEFWVKLLLGKLRIFESLKSLYNNIKSAKTKHKVNIDETLNIELTGELPDRMLKALSIFAGRTFVILSGQDLTAAEFRDLIKSSSEWRHEIQKKHVCVREFPAANHTFSSGEWRNEVAEWTLQWVREL